MLKNDGMSHGLFGKLAPGPLVEFSDWKDVARLVYANSRKRIPMYRSVVSFSEETAKELLLNDQKSWQRYIENHIFTIAEKNGIKREHLQWACAVHGEKKHPHIHVVFWDRSVRAKSPFVPPVIPNAIRRQMIKDTFARKILEYNRKKDESKTELRQITDSMVDEFEHNLRRLKPSQFLKMSKEFVEELDFECIFEEPALQELGSRLLRLRQAMPKEGRLSYQLLTQEAKDAVDETVDFILDRFPQVREAAVNYCEAKQSQAALYASDANKLTGLERTYKKEVRKILANRVLSGVRMIIRLEGEMRTQQYLQDKKEYYAEQILLESLDMLSGICGYGNDWYGSRRAGTGELSKEARKELFLKNQDKGFEH